MKAVICERWGTPDTLVVREAPPPQLGIGEVRIGVRAAALNFADLLMIAGQYQVKPAFPFSPGLELAGEVIDVAEGVSHLKPGDRVMAVTPYGAFAEQAVVAAGTVLKMPDGMDYETAAAFPISYGTSHIALSHRGRLQAGETLLVHGAAGGVGLSAVEVGKALGARVLATASTPEKLELAKRHGADEVINYAEEDFVSRVRDLSGGQGADVILDPVGGEVFDQSLRCLAWEGRLLVIGFASGQIPQLPVNLALVKNYSIVGVYWGAYALRDPKTLSQSLQTLLAWYGGGKLAPHVSGVYPLEGAADALDQLRQRRSTGKLVLEVA